MCKDADGKVGIRVKAVNKGVFVCLVARNSPAAMGGLRFGDQVLQINGNNVAGFGEGKVRHVLFFTRSLIFPRRNVSGVAALSAKPIGLVEC